MGMPLMHCSPRLMGHINGSNRVARTWKKKGVVIQDHTETIKMLKNYEIR
jgi:hypothetical protein